MSGRRVIIMNGNTINIKKKIKKGTKGKKAPNKGYEKEIKLLERIQNQDKDLQPHLRYAVINKIFGHGVAEVKTTDGTIMRAMFRDEHGKKKHKIRIRNITVGDMVMIKLDEFSTDNSKKIGYVVERYTPENIIRLRRFGDIPANFGISSGIKEKRDDNNNDSGVIFSIEKKETKRIGEGIDIYARLDTELGRYSSDESESESESEELTKSDHKNNNKEQTNSKPVSTTTSVVTSYGSVPPTPQNIGVMGLMKKGGKKGLDISKLTTMKSNLNSSYSCNNVPSVEPTDETEKKSYPNDTIENNNDIEHQHRLIKEQEELSKKLREQDENQLRKKRFNKENTSGSLKNTGKLTADISVISINDSKKSNSTNKISLEDGDIIDVDDI